MRLDVLAFVFLAAVAGGCVTAGGAEVGARRASLEAVLDEWAVGWSTGVERLLPLFTDDVYYEDTGFGVVNRGQAELRAYVSATFAAIADMRIEVRSRFVAADGRWGAIEWVWRGRQIKDFPDLPATDKPFEIRGLTVVEFRDGKIRRNTDYWNLAEYKRQAGLK